MARYHTDWDTSQTACPVEPDMIEFSVVSLPYKTFTHSQSTGLVTRRTTLLLGAAALISSLLRVIALGVLNSII